jgi:hypothetical protein
METAELCRAYLRSQPIHQLRFDLVKYPCVWHDGAYVRAYVHDGVAHTWQLGNANKRRGGLIDHALSGSTVQMLGLLLE